MLKAMCTGDYEMAAERTKGHYNLYLSSDDPKVNASRASICCKKKRKLTQGDCKIQEQNFDESRDFESAPPKVPQFFLEAVDSTDDEEAVSNAQGLTEIDDTIRSSSFTEIFTNSGIDNYQLQKNAHDVMSTSDSEVQSDMDDSRTDDLGADLSDSDSDSQPYNSEEEKFIGMLTIAACYLFLKLSNYY